MSARLVKWSAIKTVTTHTGKAITIGFAESTEAWKRPSQFPSAQIRDDFVQVAQQNQEKFPPNTAHVIMKESAHKSENDRRKHYTAYCQDSNGGHLLTQHYIKED